MILDKCNVRFCEWIPTLLNLIEEIHEQRRSEEHSNAQSAPLT